MDPALAGALGIGTVLLAVGLFLGIFVYGRSTKQEEIDMLRGMLDIANATIKAEQARYKRRAKNASFNMGRALDNAAAVASGDLDRVRLGFPDDGSGPAPGEPGDSPESAGG